MQSNEGKESKMGSVKIRKNNAKGDEEKEKKIYTKIKRSYQQDTDKQTKKRKNSRNCRRKKM